MKPAIVQFGVVAMGVFIAHSMVMSSAYGETRVCDMFHLTLECDLSSWMTFILGDVALAGSLAAFLHVLSLRDARNARKTDLALRQANARIEQILTAQSESLERRRIYVVQAFKNNLSSMMLCLGLMDKFPPKTPEERALKNREVSYILDRIQGIIPASTDVLDMMLLEQLQQFLVSVERDVLESPKKPDYAALINSIKNITKGLNNYSDMDKVIK